MGRMMFRDLVMYHFLINTKIPISAISMAKLFYMSDSRHVSSATTVQNRRCKVAMDLGYLERLPRNFGSQSIYYANGINKPNPKTLRHKLLLGDTLAEIKMNGFDIDFKSCKTEVQLMEGLRCDMYAEIIYNNKRYSLIIEVATSHQLDEEKYKTFIEKVINKEIKFPHQLLVLNVSDFKVQDDYVKKCITTIHTDLHDISRFIYNFISD